MKSFVVFGSAQSNGMQPISNNHSHQKLVMVNVMRAWYFLAINRSRVSNWPCPRHRSGNSKKKRENIQRSKIMEYLNARNTARKLIFLCCCYTSDNDMLCSLPSGCVSHCCSWELIRAKRFSQLVGGWHSLSYRETDQNPRTSRLFSKFVVNLSGNRNKWSTQLKYYWEQWF